MLAEIGVRRTFNLVRALSLSQAISGEAEPPCRHEYFWSRARSMAELAMLIARERQAASGVFPDEAYLAGLFMDCGVPVLMQRFAGYCSEASPGRDGAWPDVMEEDRKVNGDHALVGYFIACHWQLPDIVC
jgi:HD-like signal output (HDOD) protein